MKQVNLNEEMDSSIFYKDIEASQGDNKSENEEIDSNNVLLSPRG